MPESRKPTQQLSWTDWRGKEVTRTINLVIDVRDFVGTPGYALLVVAANTHLSVGEIIRYFWCVKVERGRNWISRRRWLFQVPDALNACGNRPNADGKDARAVEIMRMFPTLSVRDLTAVLKENGISRGREWVRMHRCD
jgi:hypothetical protein